MSDIETLIDGLTERQRHEFALACARRVERLMTDPRSIAALDTRQRWLRGEATDAKMAAEDAAAAAAWAAAAPAYAAAWAAAAAAWAAAAAAWAAGFAASTAAYAAWDAQWDADWDAAWNAELAWQRAELERMLGEGGDA